MVPLHDFSRKGAALRPRSSRCTCLTRERPGTFLIKPQPPSARASPQGRKATVYAGCYHFAHCEIKDACRPGDCLKEAFLGMREVDKCKRSKTPAACQLSRKTRSEAYSHE